jgi:hypothetical protein
MDLLVSIMMGQQCEKRVYLSSKDWTLHLVEKRTLTKQPPIEVLNLWMALFGCLFFPNSFIKSYSWGSPNQYSQNRQYVLITQLVVILGT